MNKEQIAVELTKAYYTTRHGIYTTEEMVRIYFEILSMLQKSHDTETAEIIEEDNNKIENISWSELFNILPKKYTEEQNKAVVYLGKKINEIIDKINNMEE